jgi:hypothetical protein
VSAPLPVVHGQPSWRLATDDVEAFVTETGGHLGPVSFRLGDRDVRPYALAPWAEEAAADLPPVLEVLRGDFFCLPFGGSDEVFDGERHPPHGETANARWACRAHTWTADVSSLHLRLDTAVRPGRVDKHVTLRRGHPALYVRHVVSGMAGPMSLGHHAMLRFPDRPGSGLVATSPFAFGQTSPVPVETPETGGASGLAVGAPFTSLDAVPTATGETADLSRYPARPGFEDLVMLVADPGRPLAWTAVTFPDEGYVWFTLKDPRVLRQTVLWVSNGGRRYPPWSGRHVNVLGLEEVTSYFHLGLAASARPNPMSACGFPTHVDLDPDRPLDVRVVSAVAAVPAGFDHVATIEPGDGETVALTSRSGLTVTAALDHGFLTR